MIPTHITNKILTVGCACNNPKGGIAQVLYNYKTYLFKDFNFIANSYKGPSKFHKGLFAIYGLISFLLKLLFNWNIRIVHIHTSANLGFKRSAIYLYISKYFKKKVIMHIHAGIFDKYYRENKEYVHGVLSKCDLIVALSSNWGDFFRGEVGMNHVAVLPNPTEHPRILPSAKDGKCHFLFMGNINRNKGVFDLIQAVIRIKNEIRGKSIFHICGSGADDELMQMINSNDLSDLITYEGFVGGDDKVVMLNKCDVYILPSYIEGFPVSILEAMSYGMPVISTNVGGIPTIIEHSKDGYLFTPGDVEKLSSYILELIKNPNKTHEMGELARVAVNAYYPEVIADELTMIYTKLLA